MPDRELLESYPLYKEKNVDLPDTGPYGWPAPPINVFCAACDSNQTHVMTNDYNQTDFRDPGARTISQVVRLAYRCAHCNTQMRYYLVRARIQRAPMVSFPGVPSVPSRPSVVHISKVGQFPPQGAEPEAALRARLGEELDWYRKGRTSEAHGYGIGAYAYYRRIVEELTDELLRDVVRVIPEGENKERFERALTEISASTVAARKIELVKDLLPSSLKPGGINPLDILHEGLSRGLHGLSDEECLEDAEVFRKALVTLVDQVRAQERAAQDLTAAQQRMLDRRSKDPGE